MAAAAADVLPHGWPVYGHIIFKDVQLRYGNDGPWALDCINLDVPPGHRVGIVGRTGIVCAYMCGI